MGDTIDSFLNDAGRMSMIEGYRLNPQGSLDSEHFLQAEERFRNALEIDPGNPRYMLNLADALFALGRSKEAVVYYRAAAPKMEPDSRHLAGVKRRWGTQLFLSTDRVSTPPDTTSLEGPSQDGEEYDGPDWNFHPQNIRTG
jgi:tetratricopeptide (TPR) repeat protein